MKPSVAMSFLLLAGLSFGDAKKEFMKIRKSGVKFTVNWWDDGRDVPYRIKLKKSGVKALHMFTSDGRLYQLKVGSITLTFTWDSVNGDEVSPGLEVENSVDRMLIGQNEEDEVDNADAGVIVDHRRLFACDDCEDTFETLCDQGLQDVCYWVPILPDWVSDDHAFAMETLCTKFGKACRTSPEDACEDYCEDGACSPNPCQNGGSCAEDIGGGHVCTCASGYGGMACQIATSSLSQFYISLNYLGTWTAARQAVFQAAADRWAEVITHIPCGGSPAGQLLISATLEEIDGPFGTLGFAGPTSVWSSCRSISAAGAMTFDIDDIGWMENNGIFEGVIMHEMGHVIGVGTLWGPTFGDCETCDETDTAEWTCPATLAAYADLGGVGTDIIEKDGGSGTACGHFDEVIFTDELMTGYVNSEMYLSKITAASLDDIDYIVDPSKVDPYILPSERSGSNDAEPLFQLKDIHVESIVSLLDDDGSVISEQAGIMVQF